jgi:hypothetical protein
VDAGADQCLVPARRPNREVDALDERARAVVERGVRDLHPVDLAHERLELVDRLQHALRQLGLVGRVRGRELGPTREGPDRGRHVVVVRAATREAHELVGAARRRRKRGHVPGELDLRERRRDVEAVLQAHARRDRLEQLVQRGEPDRVEHRALVFGGVREKVHQRASGGRLFDPATPCTTIPPMVTCPS